MAAPKQMPLVYNDQGYKESAKEYANNKAKDLKVSDINEALARAYLDGAQSAIKVGYALAEKDFEEVVKYYKQQIKD